MLKRRPPAASIGLGVSEDVPEGIFGLTDDVDLRPRRPQPASSKALRPRAQSSVRVKVRKSKTLKARKAAASEALETALEAAAAYPSIGPRPAAAPEPPQHERGRSAPPAPAKARHRLMPELSINYDSRMPSEGAGIELDNVVSIPEELLEKINATTQLNVKELSDLMLLNSAPALLGFDAASNYVRTVLDDGLGVEVDVDQAVLDVVQDLSRLDVIYFFLNKLALPDRFKRRYLNSFVDHLAAHSLQGMTKTDNGNKISRSLKELEGVLVKRSTGARTGRPKDENAPNPLGRSGGPAMGTMAQMSRKPAPRSTPYSGKDMTGGSPVGF